MIKIGFNELKEHVQNEPGIYEIYTNQGIALKVGISANIRKRLLQHRASRQSELRHTLDGGIVQPDDVVDPNEVVSKGSILAKHLYFDETITADYNLKTQEGRKAFLINNCHIKFVHTDTKAIARALEIERENPELFRYAGGVIIR